MKKTDLAKNKGLVLTNKLKNSAGKGRINQTGATNSKKDLASRNPLLKSLIKKSESK